MEQQDLLDDPLGDMDLTDLENQEHAGGTGGACFVTSILITVWLSTAVKSVCGTCGVVSTGCC
ncbi:hypothetical protein NIE79_002190 [Micromonospora sp. NIE79]|uniref:Uncharacterized protein n=1 Tax=Micromonospora trifolii TaxID=2911208 RepID=A0ABS9N257_9ACTN|nr:hypothetical protein [Micromonospora trifolii]MCG5444046.1 hypothetical protein [Micromonospora trifolii]